MTCDECGGLMLEVARRRSAPVVDGAVRAHAESCAPCGRQLARALELTAGLGALASSDARPVALPGLEARLLTAFAARYPTVTAGPDPVRGASQWISRAAAVMLCAGAASWWLIRPAPIAPVAPASVPAQDTRPALAAAASGMVAAPNVASPRSAAPRGRRASGAHPADAPGLIDSGVFAPIPSAAGLPDFESGEIVRLGIDVTALPNYGIEIPAGARSTVQADLLVGQDGQARAIRLVNGSADDPRPRR